MTLWDPLFLIAKLETTFWRFHRGEFRPHKFRQMILKVKHFITIHAVIFKFQQEVFSSVYISQLGIQFLMKFKWLWFFFASIVEVCIENKVICL